MAGVHLAPFHGDEAMQFHAAGDFATVFVERNPAALGLHPDAEPGARSERLLLNGSITPWSIGLALHLAGRGSDGLPPEPGWNWELDYEANLAPGMRPAPQLLQLGRYPPALFFAFSIPLLYGIARHLGGTWSAALAAGLYALHPALLLNGRRAMMEGPLFFFGLLSVFCATMILRRRGLDERRWWPALALAGGLALASKHSAPLFLGGALAWLWLDALLRRDRRALQMTTGRCIVAALLALAVFLALSPALWPDPPQMLLRLVQTRGDLLQTQVREFQPGGVGMSLAERLAHLVTQPFLEPPMFYELPSWADHAVIRAEVDAWRASPLAGLRADNVAGLFLTLMMLVGLAHALRSPAQRGLLAWLALTVTALLLNPLPWQRYYLPLLPVTCLLAATGMTQSLHRVTLQCRRKSLET